LKHVVVRWRDSKGAARLTESLPLRHNFKWLPVVEIESTRTS
jgi:hypothetical protein